MKNAKLFRIIVGIVSVVFAAVNYFLLPDPAGTQLTSSGVLQNFVPKIFAVLIPLAISALGLLMVAYRDAKKYSGIILAIGGPLLQIVFFLFNR